MLYLKPLSAVTQHELQAVGYKAQDLALLATHQIPAPPTAVILSNAFEEVLRIGNLKYKIDYLFSHAQEMVQQSLVNLYTGVRKALYDAKLPNGFETELREMYDTITKPVALGELVADNERSPVRVILSKNRLDDPDDNTTIIQAVNGFDELLSAVREGWALAYAPTLLRVRLHEHYPESRLRVALIVQSMDRRAATSHVYSCLPQDHKKAYVQAYLGYPDLRERIPKDYYAIGKWSLRVLASDIAAQQEMLDLDAKKDLVPVALERPVTSEKLVDRDLLELARLTRKAERLLMTPVKVFYACSPDDHEVLWINRLGFDTMIVADGDGASENETVATQPSIGVSKPESMGVVPSPVTPSIDDSADDFLLTQDDAVSTEPEAARLAEPPAADLSPSVVDSPATTEDSSSDVLSESSSAIVSSRSPDELSGGLGDVTVSGGDSDEEAPDAPEQPALSQSEEVAQQHPGPVASAGAEPAASAGGVAAKLLSSSIAIVRTVVERRYRAAFGDDSVLPDFAAAIERLNGANVFSRAVDVEALVSAQRAAEANGTIDPASYAKAVEEVAFIMGYA